MTLLDSHKPQSLAPFLCPSEFSLAKSENYSRLLAMDPRIKSTIIYNVTVQPKDYSVYSVIVSEHADGNYYANALHIKRRAAMSDQWDDEFKLKTVMGRSLAEVQKGIVDWLASVGAPGNSLVDRK
jgi:hypothetical protein